MFYCNCGCHLVQATSCSGNLETFMPMTPSCPTGSSFPSSGFWKHQVPVPKAAYRQGQAETCRPWEARHCVSWYKIWYQPIWAFPLYQGRWQWQNSQILLIRHFLVKTCFVQKFLTNLPSAFLRYYSFSPVIWPVFCFLCVCVCVSVWVWTPKLNKIGTSMTLLQNGKKSSIFY